MVRYPKPRRNPRRSVSAPGGRGPRAAVRHAWLALSIRLDDVRYFITSQLEAALIWSLYQLPRGAAARVADAYEVQDHRGI